MENHEGWELKVLSVYDAKDKVFDLPLTFKTLGAAERWFTDVVNSAKENAINKHPEDYVLYQIGTMHERTGKLEPVSHVCVGTALHFKRNGEIPDDAQQPQLVK